MNLRRLAFALRAVVHRGFVPVVALSYTLGAPSPALADPGDISSKFHVDDADPSAHVPTLDERNSNPMEFAYYLQDLFTKADLAFEKKDYGTAAKYFEAITKAVPDRAMSFARLCRAYEGMGRLDLAIGGCAEAVRLGGATLNDHLKLVELILKKPTLAPADVGEIDASVAHVRDTLAKLPPDPPVPPPAAAVKRPGGYKPTAAEISADFARIKEENRLHREGEQLADEHSKFLLDLAVLACRLGLRLRNAERLDGCLADLKGQRADARVVLPFEWSRALVLGDKAQADSLVAKAKTLGISEQTVNAMVAEQAKDLAPRGLFGFLEPWGFFVFLGLGAAFGSVALARTPRGGGRKVEAANQDAVVKQETVS